MIDYQCRIMSNEWEVAWRAAHRMFYFQYEVLMNLEMTLISLHIDSIDGQQEKYDYLRNYYMLQWGDGDTIRKERIRFFSNYIKYKWNAACLGSNVCSPIILIEKAKDLEMGILNDFRTFRPDMLSDKEKRFYLSLLGTAAINLESNKFEDIYITRIEDIDKLVPDTFFFGRNTWIYRVLGERGRAKGIEFLLNELDSEDLLKISGTKFGLLRRTETGRAIVEKRLIQEIKSSSGPAQLKYLDLLLPTYHADTSPEKFKQLRDIVDKQNRKAIDDQEKKIRQ